MTSAEATNQPPTIQDEPWTNFPKLGYSFINDHFVHDHRAVLKVNLRNTKGGVEVKQFIEHGEKGHWINDETKFWLSLPGNRSFFAKLKTGQNIKIHFDNGSRELFGKSFNLYATLNFNRQLNHLSWRLGAAHFGNICHTDNRIRIDSGQHKNFTWYNRTLITKGNLTYGLLATYDFKNYLIGKNSLVLGVNIDDKTSCYFRAENQKFRSAPIKPEKWKSYFDHFLIDIINKYDSKTNIGFEFAFQTHGKPFKEAVFVMEREMDEKWISKLKVTSNFDVNLLFRYPNFFSKQNGNLSLGLHATNLHRDIRKFNYGAQVEFNI